MKGFLISSLCLVAVSCGAMDKKCEGDKANTDGSCESAAASKTTVEETGGLKFSGYVSPAFALTVDGQQMADSEDWYTQTLDKLAAEADANGYTGWEINFDAEVGLEDLKYGMAVYVAADGKTGYAAETHVTEKGTFSVDFPADAAGENYMVRANKRVSVTLHEPTGDISKNVFWCYNFSGVDKNVPVNETSKPIILNTFVTKITKYKCSSAPAATGISLPKSTNLATPSVIGTPEAQPAAQESASSVGLHVCILKDGWMAANITSVTTCDAAGGEWIQTGREEAEAAIN